MFLSIHTTLSTIMKIPLFLENIYRFYRDGFKNMTVGVTLWTIALIKLFIMFAILRVFFFPNYLNSRFDTEQEKANHVTNELIEKANPVQPDNN